MLIITEILENSKTNKYDNYHYILTFDIDQFNKIKEFKNKLKILLYQKKRYKNF